MHRWASVSERKIWTIPLVLPARLCGAAAGNCSHSYIGKVCSLFLVRAEYIGRAPGRGPAWEGTGYCSSCYDRIQVFWPIFGHQSVVVADIQVPHTLLSCQKTLSTVCISCRQCQTLHFVPTPHFFFVLCDISSRQYHNRILPINLRVLGCVRFGDMSLI